MEFDKDKMLFMRGARMLQILDEHNNDITDQIDETTYQELERKTHAFVPKTKKRQYATDPIQIVQLKIIPYIGTKALYIKGLARNPTSGKKYDTQVFFSQVEYENENTPENITFMANDQKEYNIQPIDLATNNIRVRCNCLDFYHRFALWDFNDGSIFGAKPKPYRRKTVHYPPVNPQQTPGVCKHIIKTITALQHAKMVK